MLRYEVDTARYVKCANMTDDHPEVAQEIERLDPLRGELTKILKKGILSSYLVDRLTATCQWLPLVIRRR